jgi:hypothetical protein
MCEAAAGRKFRFGEIPCDAAPETVLKGWPPFADPAGEEKRYGSH